jgi:glutamyl-tRNA reductase
VSVVVVGLNHTSVRLEVLEATAISAEALPKALHDLRQREHLAEVAVLSTCMRTEVYATTSRFHGALGDIRQFLADWTGRPPEAISDGLYDYYDERAVEHLLRVASGLDSAVLGEGEILRQVRSAWDRSRVEGGAGPVLGAAFRRAVETGKRVRSETAIARGTTSLSHTAVMLAGERLASAGPAGRGTGGDPAAEPCPGAGALDGRRALVVGAGEMGAGVASLLASGPGVAGVLVANRSEGRAEALAGSIGARAVPWAGLADAVDEVDVVVCATAAPEPVVDAAVLAASQDRRPGRTLVVVDLGVPRNVDAAAAAVPGVALFDIGDLKAHAEAAMASRRAEVPRAEAIIAEELVRWASRTAEREVVPLIAALRERAEAVRLGELARLDGRLAGLGPAERRAVEALTRGIVAKLLHEPTVNLKAAAASEGGERLATALAELWDL